MEEWNGVEGGKVKEGKDREGEKVEVGKDMKDWEGEKVEVEKDIDLEKT